MHTVFLHELHDFSKYYHYRSRNTEMGGGIAMKATGIVRRIDDLGRVVIPKEIRRTLRFERATRCR